jgi:hypothetical protein
MEGRVDGMAKMSLEQWTKLAGAAGYDRRLIFKTMLT